MKEILSLSNNDVIIVPRHLKMWFDNLIKQASKVKPVEIFEDETYIMFYFSTKIDTKIKCCLIQDCKEKCVDKNHNYDIDVFDNWCPSCVKQSAFALDTNILVIKAEEIEKRKKIFEEYIETNE